MNKTNCRCLKTFLSWRPTLFCGALKWKADIFKMNLLEDFVMYVKKLEYEYTMYNVHDNGQGRERDEGGR